MSPFEDLQEEMTFIPTLTYSLLLFTTIFLMWDNADISLSPNQILTLMANNLPFCFYSNVHCIYIEDTFTFAIVYRVYHPHVLTMRAILDLLLTSAQ